MPDLATTKLAVIGLGYVGLPLAVEFSKKMPCLGFDLKEQRIIELQRGLDTTREVNAEELAAAGNLRFTSFFEDMRECNVFIVAVPNVPLAYGFEFHVALIGGLACLAFSGPGIFHIGERRVRNAENDSSD